MPEQAILFDRDLILVVDDDKEFVEAGRRERRDEERYFKSGVFGTESLINKMQGNGLKPLWSHQGKPRKINKRIAKKDPSP